MSKVMVVGCTQPLCSAVAGYFPGCGLEVAFAANAAQVLRALLTQRPAALLAAQRLPDMTSSELLRALTRHPHGKDLAVIVVAQDDDPTDRIVALDLGARDYVVEPVHVRELYLRTRNALLGAPRPVEVAPASLPTQLRLDVSTRRLELPTHTVSLSALELELLIGMIEQPTRTWSREQVRLRARGSGGEISPRSVDACIKRIRAKLGADRGLVETVWGEGYRLSPAVQVQLWHSASGHGER
jgi:DNA-binding response OmpR family regulator